MPELPFLEVLAENLAARIEGRRVESIAIYQPALLMTASPPPERFLGARLARPRRVGKLLVLPTEPGPALVLHLMRLGRIAIGGSPATESRATGAVRPHPGTGRRGALWPRNVSVRIGLEGGVELQLVEHGTEKRARLWLLEDVRSFPELDRPAPDPSRGEITVAGLRSALSSAARTLKPFLTDPRWVGGIGNGLADEILYDARLSPFKRTSALSEEDIKRLHSSIQGVVQAQLVKLRASMAGELPQKEPKEHYAVHDHVGRVCARCGARVARVSYADRETHYCPGCQTGGKVLKDRRLSRLLK